MVSLKKILKEKTDNSENRQPITKIIKEIEETDRLIDQIVYKLYVLTDGEIKIVEGRQK